VELDTNPSFSTSSILLALPNYYLTSIMGLQEEPPSLHTQNLMLWELVLIGAGALTFLTHLYFTKRKASVLVSGLYFRRCVVA